MSELAAEPDSCWDLVPAASACTGVTCLLSCWPLRCLVLLARWLAVSCAGSGASLLLEVPASSTEMLRGISAPAVVTLLTGVSSVAEDHNVVKCQELQLLLPAGCESRTP